MAEFGTPETWNMKVGDFIETQLPQEKPQALLDLQEQNRKQRLLDTLQKIGPFLMDESLDFIRRENFASGSKFEPNISIFEDIVLNFNQGSEYKNVKDVFEEYYKITKDPLAKKQIKKGITKGTKAEKLIQPVLSLLETPEEKVNRVFTEALSTDTATDVSVVDKAKVKKASRASVWRANIADKTDLDQQFVNRILNKNPDYIKNKKLFDYLGQTQLLLTDLKDLPLKDQLAYAEEALKGRPVYTGITRKGQNKLMRDPAHKVMEFALRNFIANEGKGAVKFFNKNGTPIKYKTGLKIPYRNSIISYKGKKHTVADLRKPGYMQKFFPNVYNNQIKINKILNQEIDNPFKKGKKINFGDFMTEVQVKGYGWAPRAGSIDILHGPDGVKGDPFDNLTFGTKRLNYQLEDINKLYRFGKIDNASRLKLLDAAEGKLKGLQGDDLLNAIVKQQVGIANQIEKGKTFGTTRQETEKLIKKIGITPTKKLTALQELASRTGAGFDPILAAKAGYEEILKPIGKGALTTAKVLGQPSIAATFAADELRQGNIKTGGAALLAPELVGSFAPAGKGILSTIGRFAANPFGKAARAFTPVGLATIGAGALKDVYDEYQRREALTDEERLEEDIERDRAADEMMIGAAEGGRIGFADGPKDPSKRKFMKLMGILSLLPFGIGKGFKMAEKAAPVVAEGAKLGFDNFIKLVAKIKAFGKEDPARTTLERQKATTYTGKDGSEYELIEDMTTGDIRVTRDKSGVGVSGDKSYDVIEDRSTFEFRIGQADETTKGKKPPDEYDEGNAVFDQDGTVADIDDVDDATIKAIEDEIN